MIVTLHVDAVPTATGVVHVRDAVVDLPRIPKLSTVLVLA